MKKVLSVLLALIMIISIIPMSTITASAEESATSGTCGENLTWTYDTGTCTLTISGTGEMNEYSYYKQPWKNYVDSTKKLVIKDGVASIGKNAFYDFGLLTSVTIPDSVTTIGDYAFYSCDNLTSVTIGNGVTTIGHDVFGVCLSITSITVDGNNKYFSSDGYGTLFNKDKTTLIQYPSGNTRTSYTIPSSVTTICQNAFNYCYSLASVTISDSVTSIGDYAFFYCTSLTSVTIPNSVTTIDNCAFSCCTSLKSVTIPDSLTSINYAVFADCISLENVTIPVGVTSIGNNAFAGCTSLKIITIPDSVTAIGPEAVYICPSLTDIYYSGTKEQWNAITIGEYNDELLNATIHFNSDGEHEHNYTTVFVEATCTEGSYIRYTCECGDTFTSDSTEALGHDFSVIISSTAGNCQEGGIITYACANGCGETLTIQTEAGSHQLVYEDAKSPTCTEGGYTAREYCEVCDYSSGGEYVPALGHTVTTIVLTTATCKQQGMQYDYCEICGETLSDIVYTPKKDHILGSWEITIEATEDTTGEKVQKCTVCGDVINRETIPATGNNETGNDKVVDNKTGVELEYQKNKYDGDVDITVEETIDETAFNLVDTKTNASNIKLYNIKMTVDGVETQPNGKVTVRIPLPAGFNPDTSYIIHIDTTTGTVEKINATYENGYLVFETTHFSYYAVVEECNYTFSIQSPSRTEIRNKDGIILYANVEGTAPNGSYVKWESSNGNFDKSADGSNLKIIAKNKGWTTFTAILCDADGNELARDTVDMYSKSGFFDKIGGFFRGLFGTTKIYEN